MAVEKTPRRRRWIGYSLLSLLLLGLALGFGVRQLIDAERLSRYLVDWLRDNAGLSLEIGGEVQLKLFPRPYVQMEEVHLARIEGDVSLFNVGRLEIELPYRTLWSDSMEIYRVRLVAPEIDVERLRMLAGDEDDEDAGFALVLPDIEAGLVVENGIVHASDGADGYLWRLTALNLETGRFEAGQVFDMRADMRVHEPLTEPIRIDLRLGGLALVDGSRLRWEQLAVRSWINATWLRGEPDLQLLGRASWHPQQGLDLGLRVQMEPGFSAALGLPIDSFDGVLALVGQPMGPGRVYVDATINGQRLTTRVQYQALEDWAERSLASLELAPLALLSSLASDPFPGHGELNLSRLQREDLEIEGLRVRLLRDVPDEGSDGGD